ncbi:MAG: DUF1330 domain-containing protein [Mycobacterium sp.]
MPEELMPEQKAFVIVQIAINDRDKYHQYETADHLQIFDRFGGKVVGIDEDVDIIEGGWPFTRTVLIEFPSKRQARSWYESDEYQAVVGLRHSSTTSNLVIAAGYPG